MDRLLKHFLRLDNFIISTITFKNPKTKLLALNFYGPLIFTSIIFLRLVFGKSDFWNDETIHEQIKTRKQYRRSYNHKKA